MVPQEVDLLQGLKVKFTAREIRTRMSLVVTYCDLSKSDSHEAVYGHIRDERCTDPSVLDVCCMYRGRLYYCLSATFPMG